MSASSVFAQTRLRLIPKTLSSPTPMVEEIEELPVEEEAPAAKPADAAAAEAQPQTPEQQKAAALLQKYMQIQYQRLPADVLAAKGRFPDPVPSKTAQSQAQPADPNSPAPPAAEPNPAVAFAHLVLVGDWGAVKTHLAELPKEVGDKVYLHMLTGLQNRQLVTLLPSDILPLADAAPGPMTDQHITLLGNLLGAALTSVDGPGAMIEQLRQGTAHFGGDDPAKRRAAARLLLSAGLIVEAEPFMPPLDAVRAERDLPWLNMHALYYQTLSATEKGGLPAAERAWELSLEVVNSPIDEKAVTVEMIAAHIEALDRALTVGMALPRERVEPVLRQVFATPTPVGMRILSHVVRRVGEAWQSRDPGMRLAALQLQHFVMTALLDASSSDMSPWAEAVRLVSLGWMQEAEKTLVGGPQQQQQRMQPMAEPAMVESFVPNLPVNEGNNAKVPPLEAKQLLPTGPTEAWLAAAGAEIGERMRRLTGLLAAKAVDEPRAVAIIEHYARTRPEVAKQLADSLVANWAAGLAAESARYANQYDPYGRVMYSGMYYGGYYGNQTGIPLTRAKQGRNVARLSELLGRLMLAKAPPVEPAVVVQAFDACHSPAEVYRREDMEQVFGDLDALDAGTLDKLIGSMRTKLAQQWRDARVQQQAQTKRSDRQMVVELTRGYDLAIQLLSAGAKRFADQIDLQLTLATLWFDQAEFLYGQKVDLATYASMREKAFAQYDAAARMYVASLGETTPEKEKIDVFYRWFQSAMGSSDLSYLTRQDRPDKDQIDRIVAAIHGLGGERAQRHVKLFGQALAAAMQQIPGELKPHYLRQALRVIGDDETGEDARQLVAFYDDLLTEIEFHLELDGSGQVGHDGPFGARLNLRYTTDIGRESGGFTKYLRNGIYSQQTGAQVNYKDDLDRAIREALVETFEVVELRMHEPEVQPQGFGRSGWRQTPIAYLVLKAKDPAVDRIPSLKIDLDFNDGAGYVILPLQSQVVLIDAGTNQPAERPIADLKVSQTLDAREADKGKVRLEVTAVGRGLVPDLDKLLNVKDKALGAFTIEKVHDNGLNVNTLNTDGEVVEPMTERSWLVEIQPAAGAAEPKFAFAAATRDGIEMTLKRYADADIVEASAEVTVAMAGLGRRGPYAAAAIVGGLLLVIVIAGAAVLANRKPQAAAERTRYRRPVELTPFTVVALLRRMRDDQALSLSTTDRAALAEAIADIEDRYFARRQSPAPPIDLDAMVDRWLRVASNGHGHAPARAAVA